MPAPNGLKCGSGREPCKNGHNTLMTTLRLVQVLPLQSVTVTVSAPVMV